MTDYRCPNCACIFCNPTDLKTHMTAFGSNKEEHLDKFKKIHKKMEFGGDDGVERKSGWRKGKYGGEWCLAEDEPVIRSACGSGKITMGGYDITLDKSGKYLRRRFAQI